jgi:hypothetical protein
VFYNDKLGAIGRRSWPGISFDMMCLSGFSKLLR